MLILLLPVDFKLNSPRERLKCSAIIAEFIVFFSVYLACNVYGNLWTEIELYEQRPLTITGRCNKCEFFLFCCYTCVTSVKNSPSNCQYKRIKTFAIAAPAFIDCLWQKMFIFYQQRLHNAMLND